MNSRQFAVVAVITFIVGMVWLISDIIFNTKASIPMSDKLQSSLEPVTPTFNQRVLETIKSETIGTNSIIVTAPSPSPSPSASALGSPAPSPTVRPSAPAELTATVSGQPL